LLKWIFNYLKLSYFLPYDPLGEKNSSSINLNFLSVFLFYSLLSDLFSFFRIEYFILLEGGFLDEFESYKISWLISTIYRISSESKVSSFSGTISNELKFSECLFYDSEELLFLILLTIKKFNFSIISYYY
jgi:hypothetical protein